MLPTHRPPIHPGEILLHEFLAPSGIAQAEFARRLGWPPGKLNEIVKGRRGVSADAALAFESLLGMPAEFWMNLQRDVDLHAAKQRRQHMA